MISVCEIFRSIQGESTFAGLPCVFIRLSGCNLSCSYCDTQYARDEGKQMTVEDIIETVRRYKCPLVECTGGEPLLQPQTPALCSELLRTGATVLVETNGSLDIGMLPDGCRRIVDIKCPSSGMADYFHHENISMLTANDQIKAVIGARTDFEYALDLVLRHSLDSRCAVIFSPVYGVMDPRELATWILDTRRPIRLGLQIHKYIWGNSSRGV
jgi:7-carboxy-7-deazaguanine synthase